MQETDRPYPAPLPPMALADVLEGQLENLRCFLAVIDAGSMALAARRLFKAPSAVTRSVRELERAAGARLCERTAQGVLPTHAGTLAAARAERISAELSRAAIELARARGREAGPDSALTDLLYSGRKLRLIARIAQTGKVSRAAAEAGLSQSGASMALARIEAAAGVPLFVRGKRGMFATEEAERLILHARRAFAELRHLSAELSGDGERIEGAVVVGTSPFGRTHILPTAIANTLAAHPDVRVTMVETHFEQLIEALRAGDIDAVIGVAREGTGEGLTAEPLLSDRMAIVARAGHPLAHQRLTIERACAARWLLPWTQSPSRKLFEAHFRWAKVAPPIPSVESADLAAIRQLLIASDLIALASARQLRFELDSGLLVELHGDLPGLAREVSLLTRDEALPSPAVKAVIAAIRAQVREDRQTERPDP